MKKNKYGDELINCILRALGHDDLNRDYATKMRELLEQETLRIPEQINKYLRKLEQEYEGIFIDIKKEKQAEAEMIDITNHFQMTGDCMMSKEIYVPSCRFVYFVKKPEMIRAKK